MKFINHILASSKSERRGILRVWAKVCEGFFETVTRTYPYLVETNLRSLGPATVDLLESGRTADTNLDQPQYPRLLVDSLSDPTIQALYEVGAVRLHPSGDTIVEPTPTALLRGLARLALPGKFLRGIVNATRHSRDLPELSAAEFTDLDRELFEAVRRGLQRSLGDHWFGTMNKAAYLLHGAVILPCTRLPRSQEFYEEGIKFYSDQGEGSEVFIFSTTSGLIVPREFRGDASKNHYRYNYFTQGLLGDTQCLRCYQWERYRTAKALAHGYEELTDDGAKNSYLQEAYDTLGRFANAPRLRICETNRFESWKNWQTLVGPQRQQLSIRPGSLSGVIGHGILYDAQAFKKRADIWKDIATVLNSFATFEAVSKGPAFTAQYGPALAVAVASFGLAGLSVERLGQLLLDPLLSKCKGEQKHPEVRMIKDYRQSLERKDIEQIVDALLSDGQKIIKAEMK